jgi:hypothetical protein
VVRVEGDGEWVSWKRLWSGAGGAGRSHGWNGWEPVFRRGVGARPGLGNGVWGIWLEGLADREAITFSVVWREGEAPWGSRLIRPLD